MAIGQEQEKGRTTKAQATDTEDKERATASRTTVNQATKENDMERKDTQGGTKEKEQEHTTKKRQRTRHDIQRAMGTGSTGRAAIMAHNQWKLEQSKQMKHRARAKKKSGGPKKKTIQLKDK